MKLKLEKDSLKFSEFLTQKIAKLIFYNFPKVFKPQKLLYSYEDFSKWRHTWGHFFS